MTDESGKPGAEQLRTGPLTKDLADRLALKEDLADRLIEKRERLAYFIVTGSAAIIAFSVSNLRPAITALDCWPKASFVIGALLLGLAATIGLYLIYKRHRVYADYLDELAGAPTMEAGRQRAIRTEFGRLQALMLGFFYLGVVLMGVVNSGALFSGRT
jgi:hypothetical protein